MNFKVKISVIMFIALAINTTKLLAQKQSNYEVGFNVGTLIYQGDLTQSAFGTTKGLKPALGIFVSKKLDPYFAIRANLTIGKIGVDESQFTYPAFKQMRNFKFTTPVTELSTVLVWHILGESADRDYRKLSPYVFAGGGLTFLNVSRDWSKMMITPADSASKSVLGLGRDTMQATPKALPIIPVGIGLKYAITEKIGINAEATYRFTFSDYIDGFSYAANPDTKDRYYGISIGVSFNLARNSYKCPSIKR